LPQIKTVAFVSLFTLLSVLTPFLFHFAAGPQLGRMFLPLQIFVFVSGLLLGWPAGILTGFCAALLSYLVSGMPYLNVLPWVMVELIFYGFLAGLLRKELKINLWLSLILTMVLGRFLLWLAIFVLPTGLAPSPYFKAAILNGWPGILLQLAFIPFLVKISQRFLSYE